MRLTTVAYEEIETTAQADKNAEHDNDNEEIDHYKGRPNGIKSNRMMSRTAEIKLTVDLDADNLPTRIEWFASEGQKNGPATCQSMMLSLWDSEKKTTVAIDLWTKDTSVDDMNLYFYQVIHKMADTYMRATKNADMADSIRKFGDGFGETLGLVVRNTT